MKIAVIGSGISGLSAAHFCSIKHDVTVFEKADKIGGHTATVDVEYQGESHAIDTGFIVFNDRTYPNFIKLLDKIGVPYKDSSMGFSVSNAQSGLEYAGNSLATLFAQKKNLSSPSFLWMLKEIIRFNRTATKDVGKGELTIDLSLGDYLESRRFSGKFCSDYLIPMGAAIWSASFAQVMAFPAVFFLKFFLNHGLLTITNKPQWHVIQGGSNKYIPSLIEEFKDSIETGAEIENVYRESESVVVLLKGGEERVFDHVIFATHSDQALALLTDATDAERSILGDICYQENSVVLHCDERLMPKNKKVWSSWNYLNGADASELPTLTYNMNILQGLESRHTFLVSLNADSYIDPDKVIGKYNYAHPQFSIKAYHAQKRKKEICGLNRSSYCGAYWSNGFHEDGVTSAIDAVSRLGISELF